MKHYLIDSENVGDFWIPLLDLPADMAKLIVFYTKNSPHMSYDSLIKLKESDRTVTFIKCYEGTNALDFQLCTELGFLIAGNPGDEFIIVTNDTGYDAAVKYWRRKEYSVKRIAGKDSRTGGRKRGTPVRADVAAEVSAILHKLVKAPGTDSAGTEADSREKKAEISAEHTAQAPESVYEDSDEVHDDFGHEDEDLSEEDDLEDDDLQEDDLEEDGLEEDGPEEEDPSDEDYEETDPDEYSEEYSEEETDEESDDEAEEDQDGEDAEEDYAVEGAPEDSYEESDEAPEDESGADPEEAASDDAPELSDADPDHDPETDPSGASDAGSDGDGAEKEDGAEEAPADDMRTGGEVNGNEQHKDSAVPEGPENGIPAAPEQKSSSADAEASGSGTVTEESAGKDAEAVSEEGAAFVPDPEEITAIVNCIGMDNLAELHNQLIQFYGDNGKDIYLSLKSGALTIEKKDWDREEKFLYYCALIFRHSDEPAEALTEENISEFASFILGAENKRKNLNSLRYALLKHYGKEKGRRYYFMLKPYVKALNQM